MCYLIYKIGKLEMIFARDREKTSSRVISAVVNFLIGNPGNRPSSARARPNAGRGLG